jgi:biopolymer transport protein ExbD
MAMSSGRGEGDPMMDINTTPLIDVMLVLINSKNNTPVVDSVKNKVIVDPAGTVQWNGSPVDLVTLQQYLEQTKTMNPEPELHFQPDPAAKYEKVDTVLAVIKRSGISKLGFIGNEQYRNDF